jgi:diaminopimelate decarboxylase
VLVSALSHVYPSSSGVNAHGHLEIGGCDAVELASEFGTPAYVVSEDDLRERARAYRDGLAARAAGGRALFATKAFPCTAVLRVFAEEGLGCDVASGGELTAALRAGFDPALIFLHGNAKSEAELSLALSSKVGQIVLDSADDIERLALVAAERGHVQDVLLRVTPGVSGDTHHAISTGQADSKFGFAIDEVPAAVERVGRSQHLNLRGLHSHIGSQLMELEPFVRALEVLGGLGSFDLYDFGGGLGVPYRSEQEPPSIASYVQTLLAAADRELGPGPALVIEPGRSLVANSTVTLYTVQTVKRNVSTWVAVDGGMSDNLRPMLYGARYEAAIASRMEARGSGEICQLAGKHCESGDVIVRHVRLDEPTAGDLVVTPATGAYGYAMANNYNGVPRPPVIFCSGGDARVVVRRETYDEMFIRDV